MPTSRCWLISWPAEQCASTGELDRSLPSMNSRRLRVAVTLEQCWHEVPGGTASSALETVRALQRRSDVEVLGVAARHDTLPPAPWTPSIRMHQLPLPRIALYESWHALRWPRVQRATGPVDVIHATTFAIPPKSAPLVVTVHDLAFVHEPMHFTKHGRRFFRRGLALARTQADAVLVPSQSTFDDCVMAGFKPDVLRLVPHGVSVPAVDAADVAAFVTAHGLPERYLLWCGTLEPRKNLPTLLTAFAAVRRHHPDLVLVLVGPTGWGDVSVPAELAEGVRLLGFLPADQLHAAYAGARVFCYPSLREGFGLPVLEAMAHGVPVVTSAGTAMAEFVSNSGILVDPLDADALAAGIEAALGDQHDELAAAAIKQSTRYSWDTAAQLCVDAYRSVIA
jgi:glycosyltransferase involved in cell wall biosynthesis